MLLNWKIKAIKRPRWNTEITVKTWARKFEKVASWRDFEMYDDEGSLIVIGTSKWVLIDVKNGKISKITDEMKSEYGYDAKSVFGENVTEKLKEPECMTKVLEYTPQNRDIDSNEHVNNIVYLEYAYDALPKEMVMDYENIEIFYKKQIRLRRDYFYILFIR